MQLVKWLKGGTCLASSGNSKEAGVAGGERARKHSRRYRQGGASRVEADLPGPGRPLGRLRLWGAPGSVLSRGMTWYNLCFKKSVLATALIIGCREGRVAARKQSAIVI